MTLVHSVPRTLTPSEIDSLRQDAIAVSTEMKQLIAKLDAHPTPDGAPDLPSYRDKGVPPPPPETDASTGINTLQPIR